MPKRAVRLLARRMMTPAARYPADPRAVFILVLCVLSGIPLALAGARPGSLNALLDPWIVTAWGCLLAVGAATTLVGTFRQTATGIILEQVGSVAVGVTTLLFALAIFIQVGWDGFFGGGIVLGWGLSCGWRWFQLRALLRHTEALVKRAKEDRER
jgi:hypothetical protein